MKTRGVSTKFLSMAMVTAWLFCVPQIHAQDSECWEFKAVSKTYYTKARDYEISEQEFSYGPYKTKEECQAAALRKRGTETYKSWILLKRELIPGNCTSCSSKPSRAGSSRPASSDDEPDALERGYVGMISDEKMMQWYRNIIDPISISTIASLLGTAANSVPLNLVGTAAGAYKIALAYVKLFEEASESALQRAMELINVSRADRQRFLTATGVYLITNKDPSRFYSSNDARVAMDAFTLSAAISSDQETEATAITKSALLAIAGYIASESGNKTMAATILQSAVLTISNYNESSRTENLRDLMSRTDSYYSLGTDALNKGLSVSNGSGIPVDDNISGEYLCLDCPTHEIPDGVQTHGNLILVLKGGRLTIHQKYRCDYKARSNSSGGYVFSNSAYSVVSVMEGTGIYANRESWLTGSSRVTTGEIRSYTSVDGRTRVIPESVKTFSFKASLTQLPDRIVQIQYESDGRYSTYRYQKVR